LKKSKISQKSDEIRSILTLARFLNGLLVSGAPVAHRPRKECSMFNVPNDLGERIVQATRLAVAAHWQMKLEQLGDEIHTRQLEAISGTAALMVTDDQLSTATHGGAGLSPRRPSRRPGRTPRFIRRSRR